MEEQACAYFDRIDELGGMVEAVKQNFPQREIADASYELQGEIDNGRRLVVGVDAHTEGDDGQTPVLRIDPELERKQIGRLQAVKARRDIEAVETGLADIRAAAGSQRNLMPLLIDAARVHVSEGEIVESLQEVWGSYTETPVFDAWRSPQRASPASRPRGRRGRDARPMIHQEIRDDNILWLTLDDPSAMNAFDPQSMAALGEAWVRYRDDDALRVAVVTGAGERAFSVGSNLKTFIPLLQSGAMNPRDNQEAYMKGSVGLVPKPVIAAVNGDCLGGGMELLTCTDIRLTVPTARFGQPEPRWGLYPGGGGTVRLPSRSATSTRWTSC